MPEFSYSRSEIYLEGFLNVLVRRRDGGKLWITAGDSALRTKPSLQPPTMKVTFGALVITAGVCGVLSFAFLATSLGTDYWYIIEMNTMNTTEFEDMSSHSGLWRINEGGKIHPDSIDSFAADSSKYTETELRMLGMHRTVVVMLPLSLVLLSFGGICGLVSALARSPVLLTGTACYFFISSLLTLCGASLYIVYSYQALAETKRLVGPEGLAYIQTSFGWSLGLAWLSCGLELLTGTLLLIAAQMARIRQRGPSKA
ncbi:LOW QUALITY PROTEIN: transmembrane protein 235 [Xiphophorus hellerii]|uniref:LOW QUALITY PROTEIN: transmembrane protein 235 n=1 Tax=Xiphophorus hellerii TaxID=8084 RepID=UPI0013B46355|nr:LOW QUALITY PROTEIN: transmembrane protein 235-like [Xiphophorus hellerii]